MKKLVASILIPAVLAGCAAQPTPGLVVPGVTLVGRDDDPIRDEPSDPAPDGSVLATDQASMDDCISIPYQDSEAYLQCIRGLEERGDHETAEMIGKSIGYLLLAPVVVAGAAVMFAYKVAEASVYARYGGGRTYEMNSPVLPDNTPSSGVDSEGRPWSCVGTTCGSANIYIPPARRAAWTTPAQ